MEGESTPLTADNAPISVPKLMRSEDLLAMFEEENPIHQETVSLVTSKGEQKLMFHIAVLSPHEAGTVLENRYRDYRQTIRDKTQDDVDKIDIADYDRLRRDAVLHCIVNEDGNRYFLAGQVEEMFENRKKGKLFDALYKIAVKHNPYLDGTVKNL